MVLKLINKSGDLITFIQATSINVRKNNTLEGVKTVSVFQRSDSGSNDKEDHYHIGKNGDYCVAYIIENNKTVDVIR